MTFGAGTAWVLLANSPQLTRPVINEAFVCPHPVSGLYGQMLSMRNGGSAIEWVLNMLGCDRASPESVDRLLAEAQPGSEGLRFWPLLSPAAGAEEAFQWGGRLTGVTLAHRPSHLLRAVVEGLACELARHLMLLTEAGIPIATADGCAAARQRAA